MKEKVRLGCVGLGRRGTSLLKNCITKMYDVEVVALCDIYEPALEKAKTLFVENGLPVPKLTCCYDDLVNDESIDAIMIMTGWHEHVPFAKKSMAAGKYTAIEVGCAMDLSECFELIDLYERTGSPLMMLENSIFHRSELMVLNMVKQGLFGEIVHCAGGYMHNLTACDLFKEPDRPNPHYRLFSYIHRNCEQYPTHELGPIAKVLNLNRGNRMLSLSSFASRGGGLQTFVRDTFGADHPYANIQYRQGDIITTVITCANGETIHLTLDTTLPRPYYNRNFTVRGTRGMFSDERHTVFLSGMKEPVENNVAEMYEKYDHPLQREYQSLGITGGHDGVDWLVCRAFLESVKRGVNTPIDAYDTVSWLAIAPLSEMSIATGGAPVAVPDFTRGRWIKREPIVRGKYCLDEICEDPDTPIYPKKPE